MLVQGCRKNIGPFEACREKPVLPDGPLPPTQMAAGEGGEFLAMLRIIFPCCGHGHPSGSTTCASRVTSKKYFNQLIVLENPYKCRQPYQTSHASFSC